MTQVRSLLKHCATQVPYYRELFARIGIVPDDIKTMDDFRRLPLLQRHTYQQQLARFQAVTLPPGLHKTQTEQSSGSSGMPIEIQQTNLVNLWWFACYLRDLQWFNIDPARQPGSSSLARR